MTTSILKISRETNNHFRFTLSIITPAKIAKTNPGAVADAMIFPKRYSEPLFSNTIQLIAIRLNPNPIKEVILPIKKRRKVPIIVGGTGLYFKSLVDGLAKVPKISKRNRDKVRNLQKKIGQKRFYKKLIKLDPLCKNNININDQNRSIRAYEVYIQTNKSLYTWFKNTKIHFQAKDFEKIFIDISRDEVVKSLSNRIDKMIKAGAIQEVKKFNKLKVNKVNSSYKIIGIREINELKPDKTNLSLIKEKITIKTRQYAKRQMTWARGHMKDWYRIAPNNLNSYLNKIS